MWHVWDARYVHIGYWWGGLRKGNHLKDLNVDGRITLKWFFKKWDGEAWIGLMWLRTGIDGVCL